MKLARIAIVSLCIFTLPALAQDADNSTVPGADCLDTLSQDLKNSWTVLRDTLKGACDQAATSCKVYATSFCPAPTEPPGPMDQLGKLINTLHAQQQTNWAQLHVSLNTSLPQCNQALTLQSQASELGQIGLAPEIYAVQSMAVRITGAYGWTPDQCKDKNDALAAESNTRQAHQDLANAINKAMKCLNTEADNLNKTAAAPGCFGGTTTASSTPP